MPILVSLLRSLALCGLCFARLGSSASAQPPAAPRVDWVSPGPGFVNGLIRIDVAFNKPVTGIIAGDLLINGVPALEVIGTNALYSFSFPQPPFGPVDVSWGPLHSIVDMNGQRFDAGALGSTWAYQLTDPDGPRVSITVPLPRNTLRRLSQVEITFNRPIVGVTASDLRLNGTPALSVVGIGPGPYRFSFPEAPRGEARLDWNPQQQIVADGEPPSPFTTGNPWTYTVDPAQPAPDLVINEILTENQAGLLDEDGDAEDWIELHNRSARSINLGGWSLSVDREEEGQWVFPRTVLPAGGYLVVWASGKDRRAPAEGQRYHTNFKLNPNGDTLRVFGPELPRTLVVEVEYPEQSPDHSFGIEPGGTGTGWRHFAQPTPGTMNLSSSITGKVSEVHFSVERGFFNSAFSLSLACRTPGAEIRYTLNGSPPAHTNGITYSEPIRIEATRIVRAAAFDSNQLPSRVRTHTYLMNLGANRRLLPVLSLVSASNNLYGRTGIMESSPRNTTKHGAAWERPVSVEWLRPEDNGGFQLDAGLRVAGGDYIRQRYNYRQSTPPEGKYSFRLYFRGDYGAGRLDYPVFPNSTIESFNTLHLRAGMNDPSNPFIKDQFVRDLSLDVGISACHGTFVYLFLNGIYKGLYNPSERVDDDFLQAYHGGGELWDVMGPNNQPIRGDSTAWNQLRVAVRKDLTIQSNYLDVSSRMDLTNFVDYLLPLIWADNDDWPHNNTRAAREKKTGALFRFYPWDAEFSFTGHQVTYDTIATTLSTLNPPWGTTDYQAMFNSLKKTAEFRLLFADRVHRAFFNEGPLTDPRIQARYDSVKGQVVGSIASFNNVVGSWIAGRRRHVTNSFAKAGFLASSNAPVASQLGGRVPIGYPLRLQSRAGVIYWTTNGSDPRTPFAGSVALAATKYVAPLLIQHPLRLMTRTLQGTNWSALLDLAFDVRQPANPIRVTEIMFNPPGGEGYEYLELRNTGTLPVDLSGYSFAGIQFRFPSPFPLLSAGEVILLANDSRPSDFAARYPNAKVGGWFSGSLDNGGERLALLDSSGRLVASVTYGDGPPWPTASDGLGSSLEIRDPQGDPNDPANWQASLSGGSPGAVNPLAPSPQIRINELQAGTSSDWVELANPGAAPVSLTGWSLTDSTEPRQFEFPSGTTIPAEGYLLVRCGGKLPAELTASFRLDRDGETIALYDQRTNRVDVVRYGPVADDDTVGVLSGEWVLCQPTPGAPNQAAILGSLSDLKINEFLADSDTGDDWIELHNRGLLPLAVHGCSLSTSNATARIEAVTFLAPGGFVALWADEKPGPGHLALKLPAAGGSIRLVAPDGEELDQVAYARQRPGVSTGRWPNGSGALVEFEFNSSKGSSNYLAELGTILRLSEIMAHASPGPDWLELENVTGGTRSLSGLWLQSTDNTGSVARFAFPWEAALNPGGRMVVYFGALPQGFSPLPNSQAVPAELNNNGAVLTLLDSLGRTVDRVEYGPQIVNRSVGRVGSGWTLLAGPSPGQANGIPAPLGAGDGLRLNEWLAGGGETNDFVELYNPAALPVDLGGWTLTDDPSLSGTTNRHLSPLSFIGPHGFVCFVADGAAPRATGNHLPFQLDLLGETLRLLKPNDTIVDAVDYLVQADAVSEGRWPDGVDQIVAFPGSPTPGAPNSLRPPDRDQDGVDDAWETLYGLDPASSADALLDFDHDGMSNLAEYLAGTNPRDPASAFQLDISVPGEGGPSVTFTAQPGRAYRVQYSDALITGSWSTLSDLSPGQAVRNVSLHDDAPENLRAARFYRVILLP